MISGTSAQDASVRQRFVVLRLMGEGIKPSRNSGCCRIPLGITLQHTSEAFAPTFNSTGIVKLLLPPGGAGGSPWVISVAHHPYSCAARAEARPRRVGARTARLWKDC